MSVKLSSKILLLCGFSILLLAYLGLAFFSKGKDEASRRAPVDILSIEGLPEDVALSATIHMDGKTSDVPVSANTLRLTPEQQVSFSLPYVLKTTYKEKDDSYRDLSWNVDEHGAEYYIVADGFTPDDKISLSLDGQKVYTIPFDWSGRIELPIMLIVAKDTRACIQIDEKLEQVVFCHTITGKKES